MKNICFFVSYLLMIASTAATPYKETSLGFTGGKETIRVWGKVLSMEVKKAVQATIEYHVGPDGGNGGMVYSEGDDGYEIELPKGYKYALVAKVKGHMSMHFVVDLRQPRNDNDLTRMLFLSPIEIGKPMALNDVFFEQSKDVLLSSSYPELEKLVTLMDENPSIKIELRGHTDNIGDSRANLILSENRTKKVADYLFEHGISQKRVKTKGLGGSQPVASNTSEENRQKNRRVEFVIVKK